MKKILLSILTVATFTGVSAQCNEIFISEYVEGSSYNKAIELYNPTSAPIDLSAYTLKRYSNGATTATGNALLPLGGTIPAKGIYVIVIDTAAGTVWDTLQMKRDTFMCPVYNTSHVMYFNGDDAMVLTKGTTVVDVIGKVGERPATGGWGMGEWTKDHTMVRKSTVTSGDVNATDAFDPSVEWDTLAKNTFSNLRTHDCSCGFIGLNEVAVNTNFRVFPNPSNNGVINVIAVEKAVSYKVINVVGSVIANEKINNTTAVKISTQNWEKGIYFVSLDFGNGNIATKKIVVN